MHYGDDAFSKNGLPTIVPLQLGVTIGQRYNMSTIDIDEVRLLYNCSSTGVNLPPIPTTTTANLFVINTTILSTFTSNDLKYIRYNASSSGSNYYYHIYHVTVPITGYYVLTSVSSLDTFGYIYTSNFYPSYSYHNLIAYDDESGGDRQFKLTMHFRGGTTYILIVTGYNPYTTGSYIIVASGLNKVDIVRSSTGSTIINNSIISMGLIKLELLIFIILYLLHQ